jgi:hypothetical protein
MQQETKLKLRRKTVTYSHCSVLLSPTAHHLAPHHSPCIHLTPKNQSYQILWAFQSFLGVVRH